MGISDLLYCAKYQKKGLRFGLGEGVLLPGIKLKVVQTVALRANQCSTES